MPGYGFTPSPAPRGACRSVGSRACDRAIVRLEVRTRLGLNRLPDRDRRAAVAGGSSASRRRISSSGRPARRGSRATGPPGAGEPHPLAARVEDRRGDRARRGPDRSLSRRALAGEPVRLIVRLQRRFWVRPIPPPPLPGWSVRARRRRGPRSRPAAERAAAQAPQAVRLTVRLAADSTPGDRASRRSENLLGDGRWLSVALGTTRAAVPGGCGARAAVVRRVRGGRRHGTWCSGTSRCSKYGAHARRRPGQGGDTPRSTPWHRARLRVPGVRPAAAGRCRNGVDGDLDAVSSDLDELQRFLEGDLGEVAQGKEGVGDALGRGATRFLLRLAGLPSLRLEVRSTTFEVR